MHDIFFKRKFFPYFIVPLFQRNLNSKTRISKMLSQLASHFTTLVLHTSIDRPLKALTLHNFYFSLQPVHPLRLGKTLSFLVFRLVEIWICESKKKNLDIFTHAALCPGKRRKIMHYLQAGFYSKIITSAEKGEGSWLTL